jgi:hypothetical protein
VVAARGRDSVFVLLTGMCERTGMAFRHRDSEVESSHDGEADAEPGAVNGPVVIHAAFIPSREDPSVQLTELYAALLGEPMRRSVLWNVRLAERVPPSAFSGRRAKAENLAASTRL